VNPNSLPIRAPDQTDLRADFSAAHLRQNTFQALLPSPRASTEQEIAVLRAAQRALPIQRLCGNGMEFADAVRLHRMAELLIPWVEAACFIGDENERKASQAAERGDVLTAFDRYQYAAAAYRFAQSPIMFDTAEKISIYKRSLSAFTHAAHLLPHQYKRFYADYQDSKLTGWLMRPRSVETAGSQSVVIIFGGADGWREEYHQGALEVLNRGLSVLLLDLPGQGETRLLNRLFLSANVELAIGEAVTSLRTTERFERVGVWGNSLGGSFAARAAAKLPEVSACCVNGGASDPAEIIEKFPRFIDRIKAMVGTDDRATALGVLESSGLASLENQINCPLLVLHGGADPLFSAANVTSIAYNAPSLDKTLCVWEDGDHCIYNHTKEKHEIVSDWFRKRL
jgi:pimeloyl-ACP methyl ester carboxylesterase